MTTGPRSTRSDSAASSPCSCRDRALRNSRGKGRRRAATASGVPYGFCVIGRHLVQSEVIASRRAVLRGLASSAAALALGGCASFAATNGLRLDASELSADPTLLIATTRKPVNGGRSKPWFGPERGSAMTVARAKLAAPGDGSLASVGLGDWRLEAVEPAAGEIGDLLAHKSEGRDVLIYVHGFRQTFENAALDAARLSEGIRFRGRTVVFSWPSRAALFDYAYDRESAMWSRDAFESVLESVMENPTAGRLHIVAHSMGTMLALESLRQLYARYSGDTAVERIGAVVFASPDIDMDVFSSSIGRIGALAGRITVITATNDRALALSQRLAGGIARVGATEKAALERLGLRVIDASQQGWGIKNHDLFLSSTEVRQAIRHAVEASPRNGA
jgi:esterase/lipase superfamily enzyme